MAAASGAPPQPLTAGHVGCVLLTCVPQTFPPGGTPWPTISRVSLGSLSHFHWPKHTQVPPGGLGS